MLGNYGIEPIKRKRPEKDTRKDFKAKRREILRCLENKARRVRKLIEVIEKEAV